MHQVLVYSDLDADQHERLGRALAAFVAELPGFSRSTQG